MSDHSKAQKTVVIIIAIIASAALLGTAILPFISFPAEPQRDAALNQALLEEAYIEPIEEVIVEEGENEIQDPEVIEEAPTDESAPTE